MMIAIAGCFLGSKELRYRRLSLNSWRWGPPLTAYAILHAGSAAMLRAGWFIFSTWHAASGLAGSLSRARLQRRDYANFHLAAGMTRIPQLTAGVRPAALDRYAGHDPGPCQLAGEVDGPRLEPSSITCDLRIAGILMYCVTARV